MSPSDPATDADAAFEASVNVVDEIEVAGDRTPEPDTDLGLSLDLDLDPDHDGPAPDAGPGYAQQEQHQESHGPQGQSQPVHAGSNETNDDRDTTSRHTRRSRSASAELANGHDRRSRAGSMKSNDHDNEETSRHERKTSEGGSSRHGQGIGPASFPTHNEPRTWIITQALSPLAVRLMRLLLGHGDYVVACLPPHDISNDDRMAEFTDLINECKSNRRDREGWKDRIIGIQCDGRSMAQCSAAVAEAVHHFGHIDILLCCNFEAVVGTVEELSTRPATQNLVRHQFETIYFSQVNFIKAVLPQLRSQQSGHIMILTSLGGHIGTPGMSIHTAATWALEGFCDSLAYEVAPFSIRVTIVQPNKEIQTLTNRIIFAPQLPWYDSDESSVPSIRDMLSNALERNPETRVEPSETEIMHRFPKLPTASYDKLVMESVHALTAIGGHENPPARHIVGFEGAVAVKEKLKIVTEELEDFVEASLAADIYDSQLQAEARAGNAPAPEPEPETERGESMEFTMPGQL